MKITFICGQCGEEIETEKIPELTKDGKKIKCPACSKWQPYDGIMEITT